MSRTGKKPINIPQGVKIEVKNNIVYVVGPKGKLNDAIPNWGNVTTLAENGNFVVNRNAETRHARREQGLVRSLVANMVEGVTTGFKKELDIVGVGWRCELKGKVLNLTLGYSHPVVFDIPEGINISVEKQNHITVEGANKCLVGEVAAKIRRLRKPEPYKGKGVKYTNEIIKRKVGKAAVGGAK